MNALSSNQITINSFKALSVQLKNEENQAFQHSTHGIVYCISGFIIWQED